MVDSRFYERKGPFLLSDLANIAHAELYQPEKGDLSIEDVAPLHVADINHISFFSNRKYINNFARSQAGACIIEAEDIDLAPEGMALLITDNPYRAYAQIAATFYPPQEEMLSPGVSSWIASTAVIDANATIGEGCRIDHGAVIGPEVVIGNYTRIGANTIISKGCMIGDNCVISNSVSIAYALIGDRAIIHPGVRIGQDGFGFAQDRGGHVKVPQLGRVIIGNDVEIGANSCIDRGAGPDTIIGDQAKIDNLVQIGHNVTLGRGCIVVAQVGIAGSTEVGDYVLIGGQVGIAGHLRIGSGVQIAGQSGVIRDVPPKEAVGGYPAIPVKQWHRQTAVLKHLVKKSMRYRYDESRYDDENE